MEIDQRRIFLPGLGVFDVKLTIEQLPAGSALESLGIKVIQLKLSVRDGLRDQLAYSQLLIVFVEERDLDKAGWCNVGADTKRIGTLSVWLWGDIHEC